MNMKAWVLFLFTIFGFAVSLWFCLRCSDIFCRHHEIDLIETAQGVSVSEDDIIGLEEGIIVR
jgi:hypothetical protein